VTFINVILVSTQKLLENLSFSRLFPLYSSIAQYREPSLKGKRLSTIDLLIKIAGFARKKKIFSELRAANLWPVL
jgi:hypothetical protein